ncbi:MAG TPA: non-homologous end-joining DNA ligase [Alphaproteobacteria bacterium]|nr:non-homologous end-joining DNA ligase [Alphaproteobacteria bacterium]
MMFSSLGTENVLKSKEYLFEPKLDGFRAICAKQDGRMIFISRSGRDITRDYPEFKFSRRIKKNCILDGEIVVFDSKGNPSFSLMQRRELHDMNAAYIVFDILELDGKNIKNISIEKRKEILRDIILENDFLQIVPSHADGEKLWKAMISRNLEGVMAKRKGSFYIDGRSRDWLKIKHKKTADCVIVGYKKKKREIASLALGLYDGKLLKYSGQVGTGFNEEILEKLSKLLARIATTEVSGFERGLIPVIPVNVCEIKFHEYTKDGKFRAPVFLGLREDKLPIECTIDQVRKIA